MQSTTAQPAAERRRGRPSVIDVEAITSAALRLWTQHGYAETGWKELAEATGVSVRSLIRHFGSRSALAWGGVDAATERLAQALDAHRDLPDAEALRRAVVASASGDERIAQLGADWVRLVAAEPELIATAALAHRPWVDVLAAELSRRFPGAPLPVCAALAEAYRSISFAALADWVRAGAAGDPAAAVDDMLRWFDIHRPLVTHPSGDPT